MWGAHRLTFIDPVLRLFLLRARGLELDQLVHILFLVYSDPDLSIKKTKEKRATQHLPLLQLLMLLFKQISQKQHQVCFTGGCASVLIKSSVPVFLSTSWCAALFWFFTRCLLPGRARWRQMEVYRLCLMKIMADFSVRLPTSHLESFGFHKR